MEQQFDDSLDGPHERAGECLSCEWWGRKQVWSGVSTQMLAEETSHYYT